jgi:hypothetical protein
MEELLGKLLGMDNIQWSDGDVHLDWRALPPAWALLFIFIGIALAVLFIYKRERQDAGTKVKVTLTILRTALLIWILLLLFGPMLTVDTLKEKKMVVAILVDESSSMLKKDPKAPTEAAQKRLAEVCNVSSEEVNRLFRLEMVKKTLTNDKLKILEQIEKNKLQVKVYAFSKTARSIKPEDLPTLEAKGTETAIGDAIRHVMSLHPSDKMAAIVLFSDGKSNAGTDPDELARELEKKKITIIPVTPGIPQPPMDIGLMEPSAVDTVLVNDVMTIDFKVSHRGFEGQDIKVKLWAYEMKSEDEDLKTTPEAFEERIKTSRLEGDTGLTLEGNEKIQDARLTWKPTQKGMFELILQIDPKEDEITKKNNYASLRVRVADKMIKVLYVDHLPRWEYRYLKNALIRDDKVLVHCLLTSADRDFPQEHSLSAGRTAEQLKEFSEFFESLHEFPRDLKSLLKYDVIIIGDVHPDQLGGEETQENLVKFASEFGGGIIFIAGMRFNPEAFVGTHLEKLLPVIPTGQRSLQDPQFDKALAYALTDEGKKHGITKFSTTEEENKKLWENPESGLPGIFWFKSVKQLKHNAFSLVDLRDVTQKGVRAPLFVWANYGRGRVFMSLTDETWRWRFLRGDQPYFFPFWKQALYWARQMRLHSEKRFHIWIEKDKYSLRETVKIYGKAYDQDFNPIPDEKLDATIIPPVGNQQPIVLRKDPNQSEKSFVGEFIPKGEGHYIVKCGDPLDEKDQAQDHFDVVIENREEIDPVIDVVRLSQLAKITHQEKVLTLDEAKEIPNIIRGNTIPFTETKEDDIWDSPLAYIMFALLITAEWIVRKIYRML